LFLSIVQQLNDPRTTITPHVVRTTVKEIHFPVPCPESTFCTPSLVHQTFGQTRESGKTTNPKWMTSLFGVDLITPNYVTSNLAFLQQFDASYSFGEQGHSSLVVAKS